MGEPLGREMGHLLPRAGAASGIARTTAAVFYRRRSGAPQMRGGADCSIVSLKGGAKRDRYFATAPRDAPRGAAVVLAVPRPRDVDIAGDRRHLARGAVRRAVRPEPR